MEVSDALKLRSLKHEKSPSEETPGGAGSRKRDWPDSVKKSSDAKFEEKGRELGQEENGYSQRRACGFAGVDPRVYRYRPIQSDASAHRVRL